MTHKVQYHPA